MKKLFLIPLFISSSIIWGQEKESIKTENRSFKPNIERQKMYNQNDNIAKNIKLDINQSLRDVYIKNNGFKKDINYFESNEHFSEKGYGPIKLNETKSDKIGSILNIILNK
ncbi:hypothetical protein [Chryseobacterium sp. JM1]|uniref:hypothetical protein n=1 Tax=Chryseobacterium sp. JM1 TaxID=1233950 RepID=UPI0004E652B1|nr:hypothetical protein [Chryseobacterium sp. JM1]KFF18015.1 hypothetical protein IW22_18695 [Chryseobacterium sp. JM1]